ncbi:retrovirus-related pol polyprotein from transposon TNT 1-94 [Tanacetum coccineum]
MVLGIAPAAIIDRQLPFEYTITSRSTDVVVMALPVQNINHSAFRSMFEREKLSGTNFNDWLRRLKLVLRVEKKMFVIEQPIPPAPAANSEANVLAEWNALYDAYNEVACLMLGSMTPELHRQFENYSPYDMLQELKSMFEKQAGVERFDLIQTFHACKHEEGKPVGAYVLKMKDYVEQLERLGYVLPQDLSVGLILNGLTSDFTGFVRNYNMHNMGKTIGELHAMLIEYEKGLPKKAETPQVMMIKGGKIQKANKKSLKAKGKGKANGKGKDKHGYISKPKNPKPTAKEHPAKDDTCHHCKEVGHWKRNCPVFLAELLKKKKQVGTASSSGIFTIELFAFPNKSWVYDTGCGTHICITKQGLKRSKKAGTMSYSICIMGNGVVHKAINLKEIQDGDTSPSEITSEIPMEVEEAEEHSLGDLNEPTSYKAAMLDPESNKWLDAMNAKMQSMIDNKCFAMKYLGEAAFILGIKIYRDRSKRLIGLSQSAYMDKILKRYKMDNSKRGHIPMQERLDLNKTQGASTPEEAWWTGKAPSKYNRNFCYKAEIYYSLTEAAKEDSALTRRGPDSIGSKSLYLHAEEGAALRSSVEGSEIVDNCALNTGKLLFIGATLQLRKFKDDMVWSRCAWKTKPSCSLPNIQDTLCSHAHSSVSPPYAINGSSDFGYENRPSELNFWEELPCGVYSLSMSASENLVGEVRRHKWTDPLLEELIKWERPFVEPKPEDLLESDEMFYSEQRVRKLIRKNMPFGLHQSAFKILQGHYVMKFSLH